LDDISGIIGVYYVQNTIGERKTGGTKLKYCYEFLKTFTEARFPLEFGILAVFIIWITFFDRKVIFWFTRYNFGSSTCCCRIIIKDIVKIIFFGLKPLRRWDHGLSSLEFSKLDAFTQLNALLLILSG